MEKRKRLSFEIFYGISKTKYPESSETVPIFFSIRPIFTKGKLSPEF